MDYSVTQVSGDMTPSSGFCENYMLIVVDIEAKYPHI